MKVPLPDEARAAEEAVGRLLEKCHKAGPLYRKSPRAVAQVSRTAKWLLNALAGLRTELASGDRADATPKG